MLDLLVNVYIIYILMNNVIVIVYICKWNGACSIDSDKPYNRRNDTKCPKKHPTTLNNAPN